MIFNSIRWRLQLWHGLILIAVLVGFGVTAYRVSEDNQLRAIDQELDQQADRLMRPPPRMFGPPVSFPMPSVAEFTDRIRQQIKADESGAFYFAFWDKESSLLASTADLPKGTVLPRRALDGLQANRDAAAKPFFGPPGVRVARSTATNREMIRTAPFGFVLLVGRSAAPERAGMRRLALWLIAAGVAVLLIGLAGGGWLATRAIRPIEEISATAQRISAGDLSQRINVADTESELGRLASVLNTTFARLEAAFSQQARFTSDASHELRTPVAVILSQTQTVLARPREEAEYREALAACQRAATRMRQLTESLLELARLDAGQEPLRREQLDLSRVARECVEMLSPLAAERHISIHCNLAPTEIEADSVHLSQLLTNLLSNAIYFNQERGEVLVTVETVGEHAQLTIADSGQGIPQEDLPHIFERFYRVDKSRSRVQGRTGLGLAICKAIVEAHHGTIEVTSELGEGTTFTVQLRKSMVGASPVLATGV